MINYQDKTCQRAGDKLSLAKLQIDQVSAYKRTAVIWLILQVLLWASFGIGYLFEPTAWVDVQTVDPSSAAVGGWFTTTLYIVGRNALVIALIVAGNLFVRFGPFTPGLLALAMQGIAIGWLAGTNGFEAPFVSVAAANAQFFRVGLWETTAYAVACGVTITKSCLVAERFPAKQWSEVRRLRDLRFSWEEKILGLVAFLCLVGAALVEALYLAG